MRGASREGGLGNFKSGGYKAWKHLEVSWLTACMGGEGSRAEQGVRGIYTKGKAEVCVFLKASVELKERNQL